MLGVQDFTGETDKGGLDDRNGIVTPTGNTFPAVTVPAGFTIPLRTPFALTGTATDAEGDPLVYSWEQNDQGDPAGNPNGQSLLWLSPNPGGVGPMTRAMLLQNVVEAAERALR